MPYQSCILVRSVQTHLDHDVDNLLDDKVIKDEEFLLASGFEFGTREINQLGSLQCEARGRTRQ